MRGKTVHSISHEEFHLTNTVLPTHKSMSRYADHTSNKEIISFVALYSDGGWLSKWIDFNGVHSPLTFDGSCSGGNYLFENLNIKLVNE